MKKLISFFLSVVMLVSVVASVDLSAYAYTYTSGNFNYSVSGSNVTITGYTGSATSVTIPSKIDGCTVTSIGGGAFSDCTSLTSVALPNSVTSIGGDAFHNCTSLTRVTIPNSVTSIGSQAFYECTSLTSITIPNSVTSIIGVFTFYNCTSLKSVTIGDSVTSIGGYAFENCSSLTSVTIGDSVTNIGSYAFENCKSLTSVTIPNSVTSIGYEAFSNCTSLTSVTIGNSVTSIGDYAFDGCTKLNKVNISSIEAWCKISFYDYSSNPLCYAKNLYLNDELVTDLIIPNSVTSIGDYAFYYCTSLTSVTIPDSVTSIRYHAFENCTSLTSVTIPNSVTSIGEGAFYDCTNLTDVYYMGSQSEWNDIGIYSHNDCLLNATIHYNYSDSQCSHNIVIDEAIEPTCTEDGLSEGSHCSKCNAIISKQNVIPALGHDYITVVTPPTCADEGYATYTCTRCEDSYTEIIPALGGEHTHSWSEWTYNGDAVYFSATEYTNGTATRTCTVCGESETKTIEGTGLLRARTATCEFASEVRAMIGVKTEQTKLFSNVYCKFTREDGKEFVIDSDKSTLSQDETTAYYPFAITPQSLHSDIKVQFYAVTNDGITVWGQEYTYNMMDNYIKKQIANTTNESWRKLLVELVYYGYENQIKAGWKLDQLLIDELTDEQKALHSTEELTLSKYLNTSYVVCENPLTTWRSVNLEFGASTNPVFRTRALALTDDIKAVVTIEGDEKVYTYNYSDPYDAKYFKVDADVPSDTTGIYFTFGELPAKRLRSKIYVTLYKGDTPITNTLEYSAETYCNSQFKKDPGMTNQDTKITYQLMRYGNAARAYFGI